jgi:prolyl 4-hydroxylase
MTDFIGTYKISEEICEKLIDFHTNGDQREGMVGANVVNKKRKDSIDVTLTGPLWAEYIIELQTALDQYMEEYPYSAFYGEFTVRENINIQRYEPVTGGFKLWHCERPSAIQEFGKRHLVFMTYLNDVEEGGETEFAHQNLKIKPEKGKTLIWPTDWMFTHRGLPAPNEVKYVATGWYSFV